MSDSPVPSIPQRPKSRPKKSDSSSDVSPAAAPASSDHATSAVPAVPVIPQRPRKTESSVKSGEDVTEKREDSSPAPAIPSRPRKQVPETTEAPESPNQPSLPSIPRRPTKEKGPLAATEAKDDVADDANDTDNESGKDPIDDSEVVKAPTLPSSVPGEKPSEILDFEEGTKGPASVSDSEESTDVISSDPHDDIVPAPVSETAKSVDGHPPRDGHFSPPEPSEKSSEASSSDDVAELLGNKMKEQRESASADVEKEDSSNVESVHVSPSDFDVDELDVGSLRNEHTGQESNTSLAKENLTSRDAFTDSEDEGTLSKKDHSETPAADFQSPKPVTEEVEDEKKSPVESEEVPEKAEPEELSTTEAEPTVPTAIEPLEREPQRVDEPIEPKAVEKPVEEESKSSEEPAFKEEPVKEEPVKEEPVKEEPSKESPQKVEEETSKESVPKMPIIPSRPSKPGKPKKLDSGSESQASESRSSPVIPSRPPKPATKEKPKAPPPKPKKLSSKIAAFQQMFNQEPAEAPKEQEKSAPEKRGKLSSDKTNFAANLQNMMGAGIALPGMANPEMLKKFAPAEPEQEASENKEDAAPKAPARRAKGPRGKKLPKSIQESKVTIEPRFKFSYGNLWELDFKAPVAEDKPEELATQAEETEEISPKTSEPVVTDTGLEAQEKETSTEKGFAIPVLDDSADAPVKEEDVEQLPSLQETQPPLDEEEELSKVEQATKVPLGGSTNKGPLNDVQSDVEPDYEIINKEKVSQNETPKTNTSGTEEFDDDSGFEEAREAFSSPKPLADVTGKFEDAEETESNPTELAEEQLRELSEYMSRDKPTPPEDDEPVLVSKADES
ncbi:hypothetical protein FT663_02188 [Candidozyma haemuli var. vulneris]|uniref:Altered inheritance of mitochondria protein 21 n=1 Tax=Candidozyma haemuli TaxID=45357 RepID=A0A2V1AX17_9ASCO|nr:hypothetical protein CXQ85_004725 [[Candida] haemuloni]KAF3990177.1 hypothetical protein FT662_02387 [[Candida] haemuloni var. vulneris]KAF3992675.1 hypothetical protein FT663_02188 [[Candida] haemuloni var. vulneris]PVH22056.1 hypothetical protein CXQ85_004725 [[Candida] haemuloni]